MFKTIINYFKEQSQEKELTQYEKDCIEFHSTRKEYDKAFIENMKPFCKGPYNKIILDPDEQSRLCNLAEQAFKGQKVSQDDPDIRHIKSRFGMSYCNRKSLTFTFSDYEKFILIGVLNFGFKHGHYSPYA